MRRLLRRSVSTGVCVCVCKCSFLFDDYCYDGSIMPYLVAYCAFAHAHCHISLSFAFEMLISCCLCWMARRRWSLSPSGIVRWCSCQCRFVLYLLVFFCFNLLLLSFSKHHHNLLVQECTGRNFSSYNEKISKSQRSSSILVDLYRSLPLYKSRPRQSSFILNLASKVFRDTKVDLKDHTLYYSYVQMSSFIL